MAKRSTPTWYCAKCGAEVTDGVAVSMDPRFATGLCRHGAASNERDAERVPLLSSRQAAESVIDARTQARALKRAMRKTLAGDRLSANEQAALERHQRMLETARA